MYQLLRSYYCFLFHRLTIFCLLACAAAIAHPCFADEHGSAAEIELVDDERIDALLKGIEDSDSTEEALSHLQAFRNDLIDAGHDLPTLPDLLHDTSTLITSLYDSNKGESTWRMNVSYYGLPKTFKEDLCSLLKKNNYLTLLDLLLGTALSKALNIWSKTCSFFQDPRLVSEPPQNTVKENQQIPTSIICGIAKIASGLLLCIIPKDAVYEAGQALIAEGLADIGYGLSHIDDEDTLQNTRQLLKKLERLPGINTVAPFE